MSHAIRKLDSIIALKTLLIKAPDGLSTANILEAMKTDRTTTFRHLHDIGAVQIRYGVWAYEPTLADVEFASEVMRRLNQ